MGDPILIFAERKFREFVIHAIFWHLILAYFSTEEVLSHLKLTVSDPTPLQIYMKIKRL